MNRILFAVAITVLMLVDTVAEAVTYSFTNIADTTMVSPVGGTFTAFSDPTISGDTVAFLGRYGFQSGIFTSNGGALATIAKSGDLGPAGSFVGFGSPSISDTTDLVAFQGFFGDLLQTKGIFVGDGGPLTTIALSGDTTSIGNLTIPGAPTISNSDVAFIGSSITGSNSIRALFVGSGGSLSTVVKNGDSGPSGPIRFGSAQPVIADGKIVFEANVEADDDLRGLYLAGNVPLTLLLETGDPAPTGSFTTFRSPDISGDTISFIGGVEGGVGGVFTVTEYGVLSTVLNTGDATPIGTFGGAYATAISSDAVAFLGLFGDDVVGGEAIFIKANGELSTVIATGQMLFGSPVSLLYSSWDETSFGFDPQGTGKIVFHYELEDGREGIAIAAPVPEPSLFLLACLAIPIIAVGRRVRR